MSMTTPPELSVSCPSTGVVELKVESREILERSVRRKGKQNVIDLLILFVFVFAWHSLRHLRTQVFARLWVCVILLYFYDKCTQVLHETVVVIPRHGIQLETHRGLLFSLLPACPLTINRRFIPLTSVRDIVINEGIRRWGVRYYLCIVRDVGSEVTLEVAFENILPSLPILDVAYRHVHAILSQTSSIALPSVDV